MFTFLLMYICYSLMFYYLVVADLSLPQATMSRNISGPQQSMNKVVTYDFPNQEDLLSCLLVPHFCHALSTLEAQT